MNGVCDTYCEGCEYLAKSHDVYCDYNSIVGHKRPCRPGKECTVRRRPAKYRRDPRLKYLEKATREAMKAEKKKKQKQERAGRRCAFETGEGPATAKAVYYREYRDKILREGRLAEDAKAIRAWRTARGLTQKQLGQLLGVTDTAVYSWEKGITGANWAELEKLGCVRPAAS